MPIPSVLDDVINDRLSSPLAFSEDVDEASSFDSEAFDSEAFDSDAFAEAA